MGMFPGQAPPTPASPPKRADTTKAELDALAYAEIQRRIRQSSGRQSTFLTTRRPAMPLKTLIGQ
jgi:hypothetical protein